MALVDAGWREKRASQVLARPRFLPTRCQSMRCGGGKFMLSRNTHTNTYTHGFLSPSSLSLFLFFLFFLPSSLPSSSSTTRKGRETVGYDGWPWWMRVPRLFVHWNYVGLSSNEGGGNDVDDSVEGSCGGEKGRSIERVKWIVATSIERYEQEAMIFFLARARNAIEWNVVLARRDASTD